MTKLPADVSSWRALYERCRTKRGESFERARIRLRSRYNAADASRPEMAISTATLQRRMGGEGGGRRRATGVMTHGNSAIARLRVEFQRNRKRRRFTR